MKKISFLFLPLLVLTSCGGNNDFNDERYMFPNVNNYKEINNLGINNEEILSLGKKFIGENAFEIDESHYDFFDESICLSENLEQFGTKRTTNVSSKFSIDISYYENNESERIETITDETFYKYEEYLGKNLLNYNEFKTKLEIRNYYNIYGSELPSGVQEGFITNEGGFHKDIGLISLKPGKYIKYYKDNKDPENLLSHMKYKDYSQRSFGVDTLLSNDLLNYNTKFYELESYNNFDRLILARKIQTSTDKINSIDNKDFTKFYETCYDFTFKLTKILKDEWETEYIVKPINIKYYKNGFSNGKYDGTLFKNPKLFLRKTGEIDLYYKN